jgi:flavin reductase (DIM6/NTAB) family NADH-FMN oxidoreductase RutF
METQPQSITMTPALFKAVLSHWASGVTVITTLHNGTPIGVTASAFNSLSLDPPLILVCLAQKLFTHRVISEAGVFAVNILGVDQTAFGQRFAGLMPDIQDRFADLDPTTAVTGCPILPDVSGWLDCRVKNIHAEGDHSIIVGEVLAAATARDDHAPLVYFHHQWGGFRANE